MVYLIFDTNIWIYLAEGKDSRTNKHFEGSDEGLHHLILDNLTRKVDSGEYRIIISGVVLTEWNRNKKMANSLIAIFDKKIKKIKAEKPVGTPENRIKQEASKKERISTLEEQINKAIIHIKAVEKFITEKCIEVPISNELKLKACNMALDKESFPFKTSKNNLADALIIYGASAYLKNKLGADKAKALFVTNNVSDFVNTDKNDLHEDIRKVINSDLIMYHRHLATLLDVSEDIEADIELVLEYQREWLEENHFYCQSFCSYGKEENYSGQGYLDKTVAIKYPETVFEDPNQLKLFDSPKIPILSPPLEYNTAAGYCSLCHTVHIVCPDCNSLMHLPEKHLPLYCEYCQGTFGCEFTEDEEIISIYLMDESEIDEYTI